MQVTLKMLHWFQFVVVCELIWARIAKFTFQMPIGHHSFLLYMG